MNVSDIFITFSGILNFRVATLVKAYTLRNREYSVQIIRHVIDLKSWYSRLLHFTFNI